MSSERSGWHIRADFTKEVRHMGIKKCSRRRVPLATGLAAHLDSEMQFKCNLHDTRCCRADHLTKRRATDVSVNGVRGEKLRVVQRVEGLKAKLQRSRLHQLRSLQQGAVPVIPSRSVERAARNASGRAELREAERAWIEVGQAVSRIGGEPQSSRCAIQQVNPKVVYTVICASDQARVVGIAECNGKAGAETRNARDGPTLRQTIRVTKHLFEW